MGIKKMTRQEKIRVLASQVTQVSPYVFKVNDCGMFDQVRAAVDSLNVDFGKRVVALDGCRLRISDPLCRELELAGCEDLTESGQFLQVFSKLETPRPDFSKVDSYYR